MLTGTPVRSPQLQDAIQRAQQNLFRLQHPDGWWAGELMVDATLCADYVLYMHWADAVDPVLEEKCVTHVRRRQLPDGGWNIYNDGPSEVNASVKAYFALKLAGHSPHDPWMHDARAAILRLGGIPRLNTYSKLYLALLGQFPWKNLPVIPVELVLLPWWFPFNLSEISSWSRAMIMPLAILNHFKPTRALPAEKQLHELYPAGAEHEDLSLRRDDRIFGFRNFFLAANDALQVLGRGVLAPLRRVALERAEAWMRERMGEGSDGLAAVFPAMLNSIIALETLGYSQDDPLLQKAHRDFEGLFVEDPEDFRIQPCLSPVWDTAINILSLVESGIDPAHPDVRRAVDWLASKEVRIKGDWTEKNKHPEASGWAFEFNNQFYPDTDDTAMVLIALRFFAESEVHSAGHPERSEAERNEVERSRGASEKSSFPETPRDPSTPLRSARDDRAANAVQFQRGLDWLLSFQCKNGGWAAFDKEVTQKWLEKIPFADHNAILDPTCSDLTGRTLELLGYIGFDRNDPRVLRAIRHLRETQEPDGTWYGRWGVNYLYGTWQVLRGLTAIGEDMKQDWIVRAREWIESCQNEDGGWGETCASYDDPSLKGKGDSTASQTAWALMALCACDELTSPIVQRGIGYLLATQNRDGSWTEPQTTGTGFPRVFYLKYDMYRNNFPLLALATYANYRAGIFHRPSTFRCR